MPKTSGLKRPRQSMPSFVRKALVENNLMAAYKVRPPYQRNDYLGWINSAKRDETKMKRLAQMLSELEGGQLYMSMRWSPKNSVKAKKAGCEINH